MSEYVTETAICNFDREPGGYVKHASIDVTVKEEIVRCRDCVHFMDRTNECNLQDEWNEMHWLDVEPDGFCAWGERK